MTRINSVKRKPKHEWKTKFLNNFMSMVENTNTNISAPYSNVDEAPC